MDQLFAKSARTCSPETARTLAMALTFTIMTYLRFSLKRLLVLQFYSWDSDAVKVDVLKIRIVQAHSQLKLGVNPPWLKGSIFASFRTMYQQRNPHIRPLAPLTYFFEPCEFGKRICYSEKGQ